ncbi:unnamed protein product, partial [Brassica oleracea var. botrytis]
KATKTLADFDLAVVHENFEDGGQAEHTPKSRHVIGKLKRSDVSIGESTATDGDREGERGTTFDRDELRVVRRAMIESDEDKALPEIESDEDKAADKERQRQGAAGDRERRKQGAAGVGTES